MAAIIVGARSTFVAKAIASGSPARLPQMTCSSLGCRGLARPSRFEEDRIRDRGIEVRFALVHGAWHGAWAWDALIPELEARDHRVVRHGAACEDVGAGAAEYAQVVIDGRAASDDVIVVGHSLGGMTSCLSPRACTCTCALTFRSPAAR